MASFNVQAVATLRPIPEVCGYLAAPPVSYPTLASDWNLDPDTDIERQIHRTESGAGARRYASKAAGYLYLGHLRENRPRV